MKIVVFFRKHNDLDQGLPIVDHLVLSKKQHVEIYGVKQAYKSCDAHLNYLKNKLGLRVRSFENTYNSKVDDIIFSTVVKIKRLSKSFPKNIFGVILSILKHNVVRFLEYVASAPAKRFVNTLEGDSVVLVDYGTESMYPFRYILKFCKEKGIRIIAYQHGYLTMTNVNPKKIESKKTFLPTKLNNLVQPYLFAKYPRKYYDRYLVGCCQKNTLFMGNLDTDFKKSKLPLVEELGIPRYCTEWENKFIHNSKTNCIDNHKSIFDNDASVNVVIFLHSEKFNLDQELLYKTLKELLNMKEVNLLIQPHPCSGIPSLIKDKLFQNNISNCSSPELIEWADVGIVFGTSIGFQMLKDNVTILIPQYLDSNHTIYEENNVCVELQSIEEVVDFMSKYPFVDNLPSKLAINSFISKYIYNNMTYNELMDAYCYFVDD